MLSADRASHGEDRLIQITGDGFDPQTIDRGEEIFVNDVRATVTAGLAKDVEEVNQ